MGRDILKDQGKFPIGGLTCLNYLCCQIKPLGFYYELLSIVKPLICVEIRPLGLHIMINSRKPEPGQGRDVLGDRAHLLLLLLLLLCYYLLLLLYLSILVHRHFI